MDDHREFYQEVGRRIQEARKRRKPRLTQESLAEMVSLTRTSITNVEKGRQRFLLHTLVEIASALHVSPASLLPEPTAAPEKRLEIVLKDRPRSEQKWIKSTMAAIQKEGSDDAQKTH
jgi:transcriptional regulator with XRE-family HTH domain